MKLLFDENISPSLVDCLVDLYPASCHLDSIDLDRKSDREIWKFARINEFIIVTKDADFYELSMLLGFPPMVVWLRIGNCATIRVESVLRANHTAMINWDNRNEIGTCWIR